MDKFNFYKEMYLEEIKRKEQLRTALTLPTSVLTVIGGIIAIYLGEFIQSERSYTNCILGISTGVLIICLLITIYYLARSYHGYEYIYIPCLTDLEYTHKSLEEYYQSKENGLELAKNDFQNQLMIRMANAQEKNSYNNDSKSEYLHNAIRYLFYCLILTSISAIPFYLQL